MADYYVVLENSFEYNDEIYSPPECGGGKPVKVFTSNEKAQEHCDKLNLEFAREDNHLIFNTSYDFDFFDGDKESMDKLEAIFQKYGMTIDDLEDYENRDKFMKNIRSKMTDEELKIFVQNLKDVPYSVYTVTD